MNAGIQRTHFPRILFPLLIGMTFALRLSVYTLTHASEGECWSLSQYSDWPKNAGFNSIETHGDIPKTLPRTTLILATKS